ncbi:MAG: GTP 3',8-cyclase MoaA [Elusimicrobiota bacterium]
MTKKLVDKFGRIITYLRISLTDRCNLRCVYCMPAAGIKLLDRNEILTYEEILKIIGVATGLGMSKFRFTGGEPLLRKGAIGFIRKAVALVKSKHRKAEFTLTTNGILLQRYALRIFNAGVKRINVSMDTLNPEKFKQITRGHGDIKNVISGIKTAIRVGFSPVKINVVVVPGFNSDEIESFINFARKSHVAVRFIEQMPFGRSGLLRKNDGSFIPLDKIETSLVRNYSMVNVKLPGAGPGRHYGFPSPSGKKTAGQGFIGFIPAISQPFCRMCNRLRLTADGKIRLCLGYKYEIDIKSAIRSGATDEQLKLLFTTACGNKPRRHNFRSAQPAGRPSKECMSRIGG